MKLKYFFLLAFLLSCELLCIERPMVLVITSYNNAEWYKKNLDAVFSQDYSNYRVVYVDDCSTDGTGELVAQYIKERALEEKILLIRNKLRMFKMYNLVHVIHNFCKDEEIVLDYDGDDWYCRDDTLSLINDAYEDQNVWMTYGNWVGFPKGETSNCREVPEEVIRDSFYRYHSWITSAQRTFYAWLFKKIRIPDLMRGKNFVRATIDMAYMFPMLEMSGGKFKFIEEVVYVYNKACTNTNDEMKFWEREEDRQIRRRKRYKRLRAVPEECNS